MIPLPKKCPLCGGEIAITRLHCRDCDTTFDGHFASSGLGQLTQEQLDFVETFVRCEGKINRMEDELGISYPTIRRLLQEVIRSMGYEPGGDEPGRMTNDERQKILEDLDKGLISADKAMRMLQES